MKQESKRVGRQRVRPGQQLFAYNLETHEVVELGTPKKVELQSNMIYRVALNKRNFLRKLNNEVKLMKQSK